METEERPWEFVRASTKPTQQRKAYLRRRPYTRAKPTLTMLEFQRAFTRAASKGRGKKGKILYKGNMIPATCGPIIAMKGKKIKKETKRVPEFLDKFAEFCNEIGKIATFKSLNKLMLPQITEEEYVKLKKAIKF